MQYFNNFSKIAKRDLAKLWPKSP